MTFVAEGIVVLSTRVNAKMYERPLTLRWPNGTYLILYQTSIKPRWMEHGQNSRISSLQNHGKTEKKSWIVHSRKLL